MDSKEIVQTHLNEERTNEGICKVCGEISCSRAYKKVTSHKLPPCKVCGQHAILPLTMKNIETYRRHRKPTCGEKSLQVSTNTNHIYSVACNFTPFLSSGIRI